MYVVTTSKTSAHQPVCPNRSGGGYSAAGRIHRTRFIVMPTDRLHADATAASIRRPRRVGRGWAVQPSGQRDCGLSGASSASPRCWTETMTSNSVTIGPQVSALRATVRNCLVSPRFGPSTITENSRCRSASRTPCKCSPRYASAPTSPTASGRPVAVGWPRGHKTARSPARSRRRVARRGRDVAAALPDRFQRRL